MYGVISVVQITFCKVQTGGTLVMVLGSEFHIERCLWKNYYSATKWLEQFSASWTSAHRWWCIDVEMVSDRNNIVRNFQI